MQSSELERIRQLTNQKSHTYAFLGYTLDLDTGEIHDLLTHNGSLERNDAAVLNVLLSHYSAANPTPRTGRLVKFKDLPGGHAYEQAFFQRAVQSVAQAFGAKPTELVEAAELLKGTRQGYGDSAAEVPALVGIPIVFIVWAAGEFPASATVLYDESASSYLPTEDLAVLGELAAGRLRKAQSQLSREKANTLG